MEHEELIEKHLGINTPYWIKEKVDNAINEALTIPDVVGRSEQFDCYEIWRPNIPADGCKTQCKECAEKQKQ